MQSCLQVFKDRVKGHRQQELMGISSQGHQAAALSLPLLNLDVEGAYDSQGGQHQSCTRGSATQQQGCARKSVASDISCCEHSLLTASCMAVVLCKLTWQSIPVIYQPA